MRPPAFWWQRKGFTAALLAPAAGLYGALAARRLQQPGEQAPCPVICLGNFTVGGAGKTPAAIALARLLQESGAVPAFLTRGYGGRLAGPVVVDPAAHGAGEVGDEPLLLARTARTIVSRRRPAGARLCSEGGASIILMDDGLQNPSLRKDLTLALVDGATGIGNGACLPAGPLRAPLDAQWPKVDAVVVVGQGAAGEAVARAAEGQGKPVFQARIGPSMLAADAVRGRRVLAFAGIGRPEKLFRTLEEAGALVVHAQRFPDHHAYRISELQRLAAAAAAENLALITTEKDLVRIAGLGDPIVERITALPVTLSFEQEGALLDLVRAKLAAFNSPGSRAHRASV